MRIFVRVAELKSFTQAAESMGLPKATVSAAVQQLEGLTGTALLHRTTRRVSLTQDGAAFYERCLDLVADIDEIESMFKSGVDLRGRLRIDLPSRLARSLVFPLLPQFLEKHPQLEFEISTTDRKVNVIQEGFDCVVRVGFPNEPGLVVREIGVMEMCNLASPAYLERYGTPQTLEDLNHHRLVHYSTVLGVKADGFEYQEGGVPRILEMPGSITVNNSDAYHMACVAGLGIIQVPRVGNQPDLTGGVLVEILPHLKCKPMPISLLYPQRRKLSQRVKVFLDWLESILLEHLK